MAYPLYIGFDQWHFYTKSAKSYADSGILMFE